MGLAAPAGRGRPGRQRLHAGCATSSRRVGWGVRGHVAQWRPQTRGLLGCGGIELRPFPTHTCFRRLGKRVATTIAAVAGARAGLVQVPQVGGEARGVARSSLEPGVELAAGHGVRAAGVGRRRALDEPGRGLDAGPRDIGEGVTGLAGGGQG